MPRELLKALDVHVIGSRTVDPEDEVLVLRDRAGRGQLIVCRALPARPGHPHGRGRREHGGQERKLTEGIRDHYAAVAALAEEKRSRLGADLPIVATGHLFAAGGQTMDGDGVLNSISAPWPGSRPGSSRPLSITRRSVTCTCRSWWTTRRPGATAAAPNPGHGLWRGRRTGVAGCVSRPVRSTVAPGGAGVPAARAHQGDFGRNPRSPQTLTAVPTPGHGSRSSTPATR